MSDIERSGLIRVARAGVTDATDTTDTTGAGTAVEPLDLGHRVRELRRARGWTLQTAASAAGLARSTLSKIENGQMSPTYDALKKLAGGLAITVPQLFAPPESGRVSGRMALTRSGEGQSQATATYEHRLLAGALSTKQMLPYTARIRARSLDEFGGWVRHDGEEFLFVLTGQARLYTEFYQPVDLGRGDSAYYDASMGHNLVSISPEDATVLWVTSLV